MLIINSGRGSGKTVFLIELSAATGRRIIVLNQKRADYIKDLAKEIGFTIPAPLAWRVASVNPPQKLGYLMDEYDDIAQDMMRSLLKNEISVCTTTRDEKTEIPNLREVIKHVESNN